jgi:hypothetical protein
VWWEWLRPPHPRPSLSEPPLRDESERRPPPPSTSSASEEERWLHDRTCQRARICACACACVAGILPEGEILTEGLISATPKVAREAKGH